MTVTINVNAYTVNSAGEMEPFGGNSQSSGTEFNIINDTLKKHLGKEAYYGEWEWEWEWELGQAHFVISMDMETDEGIDNAYDYVKIINEIYEPIELFDWRQIASNYHILFEIVYLIQ